MARKNTLTPASIESLKEGKVVDSLTQGLWVELRNGKPVWHYRRRVAGTAITFKRVLGVYPAHSIADARTWASQFNELLDAGIDPRTAERDAAARDALTVAKAHELYMIAVSEGRASRAKRRNKPSTIADKQELYDHEIAPVLGEKLVFDITEGDLTKLVLATGKRAKIRANRLATELKVFFGWAASLRGSEIGLSIDPATRLSDLKFPETPRKRVLTLEEIGWFLQALVTEPMLQRRGMLLWLLTAARLGEVSNARSSEFENGVWTIPEDRAKNSRAHRIALGPWGQSLIRSNTDWVFPSDRTNGPKARCVWYKARNRVLAEMSNLAGRPIEKWTPHDLRRTARSNTKRLNVDFETAEAMLNHAKTGLERTYDGYALEDEKRDWFWRWENELIRIAVEVGVAETLGAPREAIPDSISPSPPPCPGCRITRAHGSLSKRAHRRV